MTQAVSIASADDSAAAAVSWARGVAGEAASSAAQEWMGQYGTAQVQLSLGDGLFLENSSVDWLLPFYNDDERLFFVQAGARNKDECNTVNLGIGTRVSVDNWLYGVNTFYDFDLTGDNRRWGVGGELFADYLKLSANAYIGITDWHQSGDFKDYDERPADGFDLRAEGWLPVAKLSANRRKINI